MNTCQLWEGHIDPDGYGRQGRARAHRLAYEQANGPIPPGMVIDHDCHNRDPECRGGVSCAHRRCVNPDHLVARSPEGNSGAARDTRARCSNGHEFDEENSYTRPDDGYRKCRACNGEAVARYRARKRVAA